ncbi:DNA-binding response regulator [Taibaiella sp. KBW10]|uniref:LytR/AlgR family response regulator transcription factor n=1 Tax=Taibaiella sp. KBW10 TaxID=2153357 RepID=UPI000F597B17|nr:LytTR family DNA-binding domain-containing protein [Taibaiella sp. KBW10]RQO31569.1 DNA-binding response regulator [Taibaiella sp. KBW10]
MKINTLKAVIIEDELAAVNALKAYLGKYCPQVELLGVAHNCNDAISLINEVAPQLVFLDVEMPFGNAFDVLEGCKSLDFETIFVTAYSDYALRALNQSAAYYLLKPISIEELIVAVNKVGQMILQKDGIQRNQIVIDNNKNNFELQKLILPTVEGFEVVQNKAIIRLKGNGNFTDIYMEDGTKKMVCRFLKHFEELLTYPFVRIHKSHIINVNFVKKYHKGAGGYVILNDGNEIEVSASYKEHFLKSLV